jgi:hypothetical protein
MTSIHDFINLNPKNKEQYSTLNPGIKFTITGITETNMYLTDISSAPDLSDFIENSLRELEVILYNTAPVDTGLYRESISVDFESGDVSIGEGVNNKSGDNYAKFLQFGAMTLYNAAVLGRQSDRQKWPYTRIDSGMGILHDTRRLVYAWEHTFYTGLDAVNFAQPRTRGGQFAPRRF